MEVRRDPRSFIILIILLFLLTSPEPQGQQPFSAQSHYEKLLARERDELNTLNRTRYGDFDPGQNKRVKISGLNDEDGFAWDLLGPVQQRAKDQIKAAVGATGRLLDGDEDLNIPIYRNITGYVQGEWARSSLGRIRHPLDMNTNTSTLLDYNPYPLAEYDRNLTGASGTVRLHFTELEGRMQTDQNRSVSEVSARVVIGDNDSTGSNWWEFVLHGVHYPKLGGIVLTTTSERFAGVFALPHFQLSHQLYNTSQELLNRTIQETIEGQTNRIYPIWNPWSSAPEGGSEGALASPHCEFVLFLQQHPIQFRSETDEHFGGVDMDWLEQELRFPTGSPVPRRSPLTMSMVGFSPDCGFVIESKGPPEFPPSEYTHLVGSKAEEFNDRARHSVLMYAGTLSVQLLLLLKQLKDTATPSTRNRVSVYTVAILAVGDGFTFLALIFLHLFLNTSQLALFATAFLSVSSVILGIRFMMDILTVQVTEQIRQHREQASTSTPPSSQSNTTLPNQSSSPPVPAAEGLPLPATATRPRSTTPVIIAPDQDDPDETATTPPPGGNTGPTTPGRAELGALYFRYCFFMTVLFLLTLQFTAVRSTVRAFYFNTLCFAYLSFWCPQMYRNIMRNCRKAVRWDFVIGQSATRLIPIAYFYAVSDNVLFSRTDLRALLVLAGWVWVQILALASQEVLGPRFFIREGWAPPAYDYHPILREDEEGATMPIGSSQSPDDDDSSSMSKAGECRGKGMKVFDCSICATDIEVPVVPSEMSSENAPGLGGMILQRRGYMVTPCRHIFHTPCLEGWMRYRLQCPNCREILPPL